MKKLKSLKFTNSSSSAGGLSPPPSHRSSKNESLDRPKGKGVIAEAKFRTRRLILTKLKRRTGDLTFKEQYDVFKQCITEMEDIRETLPPLIEAWKTLNARQAESLHMFSHFFADSSESSGEVASTGLFVSGHLTHDDHDIQQLQLCIDDLDEALVPLRNVKAQVLERDRVWIKLRQTRGKLEKALDERKRNASNITHYQMKYQSLSKLYTNLNTNIESVFSATEQLRPYLVTQAYTYFLLLQSRIYAIQSKLFHDAHTTLNSSSQSREEIPRSLLKTLDMEGMKCLAPFDVIDDIHRASLVLPASQRVYYGNPPLTRFEPFANVHFSCCPFPSELERLEAGVTKRYSAHRRSKSILELYAPNTSDRSSETDESEEVPLEIGSKVSALYDFDGDTGHQELSFKYNDVMTVVSLEDPHWIFVENEGGQFGYVPHNYIQYIQRPRSMMMK